MFPVSFFSQQAQRGIELFTMDGGAKANFRSCPAVKKQERENLPQGRTGRGGGKNPFS